MKVIVDISSLPCKRDDGTCNDCPFIDVLGADGICNIEEVLSKFPEAEKEG